MPMSMVTCWEHAYVDGHMVGTCLCTMVTWWEHANVDGHMLGNMLMYDGHMLGTCLCTMVTCWGTCLCHMVGNMPMSHGGEHGYVRWSHAYA